MANANLLTYEEWKLEYPITFSGKDMRDLDEYHAVDGEEEIEYLRKLMYANYVKLMTTRNIV